MSTYSPSLRIELITNGTQAGTWGDTTNSNLAYILDTAIAGYQTVSVTSASQALTYTSGPTSTASANQSVYAMLRFTTTIGAAFAVYAPPASKAYIIWNNSGFSMTIYNSTVIGNTTAAGTGIVVADGKKVMVFSDATNFYTIDAANLTGTLAIANGGTGQTTANAALNALLPSQTSNANKDLHTDGTNSSWDAISLSTADVTGTLAVANGGTGVTSSTGSGSVVLSASPTFTGTPLAPTAAVGTDSTQIATTAFVRDIIPTGVITLWYGNIGSIPSGWLLCNGSNGTPDLRDRFVVGAGNSYAVSQIGGTAEAIVVSHTHTASSTSSFSGNALGTHTHTATDLGHAHQYMMPSTTQQKPLGSGQGAFIGATDTATSTGFANISVVPISAGIPTGNVSTSTTISSTGSSGANANLPPYYALAYIMKA
jgi:hypothetical protein